VCHEKHPDDRAGQRPVFFGVRQLHPQVTLGGCVQDRTPVRGLPFAERTSGPRRPAISARRLDARQRGTFAVLVEDPPAPQHQGDLARQDHGALIDGTQQSQCQQPVDRGGGVRPGHRALRVADRALGWTPDQPFEDPAVVVAYPAERLGDGGLVQWFGADRRQACREWPQGPRHRIGDRHPGLRDKALTTQFIGNSCHIEGFELGQCRRVGTGRERHQHPQLVLAEPGKRVSGRGRRSVRTHR